MVIMQLPWVQCCILLWVTSSFFGTECKKETSARTIEYVKSRLEQFNNEYERMRWLYQTAEWTYGTNVTEETAKSLSFSSELYSEWMKKWKMWARGMDRKLLPTSLTDMLDIIASGIVMSSVDARRVSELRSEMTQIYSSANISIPATNAIVRGEEAFASLMGKYRDPERLEAVWRSWRLQVGESTRPLFINLVGILNNAARENGYENLGTVWRKELGLVDVLDTVLSLWKEVKPFYSHLHAYTHHKLKSFYGSKYFSDNTFIPAHMLVNLWAENWASLSDILLPYQEQPNINLTANFISRNYSFLTLAEKAEEFYTNAGLNPMEISFWQNSMFEKPKDGRVVDCHPTSYDFALKRDFRIKMCGEVMEQSFIEIIHEMGHIQYYMAYHHLPMLYRNGANSAFHEAVGETMVYTALSPECLNFMNITKSHSVSSEIFLNSLMKQALSKFVLLPWALTVEIWRYMLLAGDISEKNMNEKWWELRKEIQGIVPPNDESATLFDAGTKYHIINNIPYMRYFVSRFLEHQFLEVLCDIAGDNIHNCCFIKSVIAGERLKKMLSLGSSVSWEEALNTLTGQRQLSANPIIRYYKPLFEWLVNYNKHHNIEATL